MRNEETIHRGWSRFLQQAVNLFISAVMLDMLTWDSLLEPQVDIRETAPFGALVLASFFSNSDIGLSYAVPQVFLQVCTLIGPKQTDWKNLKQFFKKTACGVLLNPTCPRSSWRLNSHLKTQLWSVGSKPSNVSPWSGNIHKRQLCNKLKWILRINLQLLNSEHSEYSRSLLMWTKLAAQRRGLTEELPHGKREG